MYGNAYSTPYKLILPACLNFRTSGVPTAAMSQEVPYPTSQDLIQFASQGISQTQEETQLVLDTQVENFAELKRQSTAISDEQENDNGRKAKKVKISIGPPVDLGD